MKTRVIKSGDSEDNGTINLEDVDDREFGSLIGEDDGQLSLDVYQTPTHLVVIAPVAGVDLTNLEVGVSDKEVLTIKGSRSICTEVKEDDFLRRECFWGNFSRSIVLPEGLDVDQIAATFKRGVLKIQIPKIKKDRAKKVKIED